MLPLHRNGDTPIPIGQGAWREMTNEVKQSPRIRWRLRQSRLVLLCGAVVFTLWWFVVYVAQPPMLFPASPFPPPPPLGHADEWMPPKPASARPASPQIDWNARADAVKEAFVHAYHGYEKFAMPKDELLPLSNGSINNFNGWGVTMVDSLDTMYLMGLHDEFERGVKMADKMNFGGAGHTYAPFFETVIRYLGGLLSAYGLSRDITLLKLADELGMTLLPAFNTSSGFPSYSVNTKTGMRMSGWTGPQNGWLAEVASCQMEYKYLAKLTGRKEYYQVADKITKTLYKSNTTHIPGRLFPTLWNLTSGEPVNQQVSIGAMADSAYEYFLKQYLLTGQTEQESLELYLRSMTGIIAHNLYVAPRRGFLYVTDQTNGYTSHRFEHLACFLPGLLALGADQLPPSAPLSPDERRLHKWAAHGLALSCGAVYSDVPSGLGADEVQVTSAWEMEYARLSRERDAELEAERARLAAEGEPRNADENATEGKPNGYAYAQGSSHRRPVVVKINATVEEEKLRWVNVLSQWQEEAVKGFARSSEEERTPPGLRLQTTIPVESEQRDYKLTNAGHYLRPETIESFFMMWRTTGDVQWRERGWAAFQALQKESRTASGYATLKNVDFPQGQLGDSMPSYFLAETLKYLYLLFSEEEIVPLDRYVFNTEAHPFPVFQWTEWEKTKFGIS